jgi:hypothetical protein
MVVYNTYLQLQWENETRVLSTSLWRIFTIVSSTTALKSGAANPILLPYVSALTYDSFVDCILLSDLNGNLKIIPEATATVNTKQRSDSIITNATSATATITSEIKMVKDEEIKNEISKMTLPLDNFTTQVPTEVPVVKEEGAPVLSVVPVANAGM